MAEDAAAVHLHAFVPVFVASRWWEWTHTCFDREAIETPKSPPPPNAKHHLTTKHHHHLPLLLSAVHKRPHVTPDPAGIHSDWGKVARSGPAGTMLSGQRGEEEGGRVCMQGWMGREGGRNSLPLLSPSVPPSFCPSLHAHPEVERSHNKPGTERESQFFPSWGGD